VSDLDLARLGVKAAAQLDRLGYPGSGIVRQLAQRVNDLATTSTSTTSTAGCRGCGAVLDQPATGGRRLWCTERCRRRHRR